MQNIVTKILCGFDYSDSGSGVNTRLKEIIASGTVRLTVEVPSNDTYMLQEVSDWALGKFKPWAEAQIKPLGFAITPDSVCLDQFILSLNNAIQNFSVAGAYYTVTANRSVTTGLEARERLKAAVCREFAEALSLAYTQAIAAFGGDSNVVGSTGSVTNGSFVGSAIQHYDWNGVFNISYPTFISTSISGGETKKEKSNLFPAMGKDHLPWIIAGAFGLLAWTSAASKSDKSSKQQ